MAGILLLGFLGTASLAAVTARAAMAPRSGPSGDAPLASTSSSGCWQPRDEELGFLRAANEARERGGKSRLRLDPELSKAARVHTREMVDRILLHHTSTTTLGRRVTRWLLLGENVGVGNTVDSLHTAFMASPAHRANIMLGSFRFAGVGTVQSANRLWVTVIFENRRDPGTRLRMPRC